MFFESTAFELTSFPVEPYLGRFAGSFQDFGGNGITGDLYLVNNHALFLYNFSYDGQGTGNEFLHNITCRSYLNILS